MHRQTRKKAFPLIGIILISHLKNTTKVAKKIHINKLNFTIMKTLGTFTSQFVKIDFLMSENRETITLKKKWKDGTREINYINHNEALGNFIMSCMREIDKNVQIIEHIEI